MAACALEIIGIDKVITGELSAAATAELGRHLQNDDCPTCDRVMHDAGVDEQMLLMVLSAAGEGQPTPHEVGGLWQRVAAQLPASNVVTLRPVGKRLWARRDIWVAAPLLAAAAVLLLVALPKGIGPEDDLTLGIKGDAQLPRFALVVGGVDIAVAPNGGVAELRYDLDRDGWLALFHWRAGAAPTSLFAGRAPAAIDGAGRFPSGAGHLAYRFDDEPGLHLFVLCFSDAPVATEALVATFDRDWFGAPRNENRIDARVAGRAVAVHAVRVSVTGAGTTP